MAHVIFCTYNASCECGIDTCIIPDTLGVGYITSGITSVHGVGPLSDIGPSA